MQPPRDPAALEAFVHETAMAAGIPIDPAWRRTVAEHFRPLLDAADALEQSGLCDGEPAIRYEP
jgi:hypothetical protein